MKYEKGMKVTESQVLADGWELTAAGKNWTEYESPCGYYGVGFEDGKEGTVYDF